MPRPAWTPQLALSYALPITEHVCPWCGAPIAPLTNFGVFCSKSCAMAEIAS